MPGRFRIAKELDMLYSILKKTLENHFIQVKEFFVLIFGPKKVRMAHYYSQSEKGKCNITVARITTYS